MELNWHYENIKRINLALNLAHFAGTFVARACVFGISLGAGCNWAVFVGKSQLCHETNVATTAV